MYFSKARNCLNKLGMQFLLYFIIKRLKYLFTHKYSIDFHLIKSLFQEKKTSTIILFNNIVKRLYFFKMNKDLTI